MKSGSHFEWIDFLRGLSALVIVLFHVRVDLWVGWVAIATQPEAYSLFDRAAAWLSIPLPFLDSAVMLFFIVSGFCIHYPYAASDRSLELTSYSIRRFFRIYPPYLAAVLFSLLIEGFLSLHLQQEVSSPGTMLKTLFMLQNYGQDAGQLFSNVSLWSLPVEVELYLVYPLFYWLFRRWGMKISMLFVGSVSLSILAILMKTHWYDNSGSRFGNFAFYWIIWCAGALLAEWVKRERVPQWKNWAWAVMGLTAILAIVVQLSHLFVGLQDFLWACFYFTVILWGFNQKNPLGFLNPRMKQWLANLGLISYSLYLIHVPFFKLCGFLWLDLFGSKPANFFIPIGFSLVSVLLAGVFYSYIEAPTHRLARKLGGRGVTPRVQSS